MIDEYTPTTEDVEAVARVLAAIESRKGMKSLDEVLTYQADKWRRHTYEAEQLLDEMRPWIAAHDREVAAGALREFRVGFGRRFAFQDPYGHFDPSTVSALHRQMEGMLDAEADRIESQASEKGASNGEQ